MVRHTSKNVSPKASRCLGANATLISVAHKNSIELVLVLNSRSFIVKKLLWATLINYSMRLLWATDFYLFYLELHRHRTTSIWLELFKLLT